MLTAFTAKRIALIDRIEKWDISDLDNGHIDVKL